MKLLSIIVVFIILFRCVFGFNELDVIAQEQRSFSNEELERIVQQRSLSNEDLERFIQQSRLEAKDLLLKRGIPDPYTIDRDKELSMDSSFLEATKQAYRRMVWKTIIPLGMKMSDVESVIKKYNNNRGCKFWNPTKERNPLYYKGFEEVVETLATKSGAKSMSDVRVYYDQFYPTSGDGLLVILNKNEEGVYTAVFRMPWPVQCY